MPALTPLTPPVPPDKKLPWGVFMIQLQDAYKEMRALAFQRDCERFAGMPEDRYCLPDPSTFEGDCDIASCDRWFSQQVALYHLA